MRTVDYASFNRPCIGERVSGDVAFLAERDGVVFAALVDVLGHGPHAHELARRIEHFLEASWSPDIVTTLNGLHADIKGTRGAVAGLGCLDIETGELRYAGVGNTTIRRFDPHAERLYSVEGIIGAHMRDPVEQNLKMAESNVVVLHSDGIRENFEPEEYPQLLYQSARSAARNIVHRFGKTYDDAACIVLRYKR